MKEAAEIWGHGMFGHFLPGGLGIHCSHLGGIIEWRSAGKRYLGLRRLRMRGLGVKLSNVCVLWACLGMSAALIQWLQYRSVKKYGGHCCQFWEVVWRKSHKKNKKEKQIVCSPVSYLAVSAGVHFNRIARYLKRLRTLASALSPGANPGLLWRGGTSWLTINKLINHIIKCMHTSSSNRVLFQGYIQHQMHPNLKFIL